MNEPTKNSAGVRMFLARRWAECVLSVIVVSASMLALFWVFTVPLLQNPDETSHIDYAFSIYTAGRLLNARTPPSEWNVQRRLEGQPQEGRVAYEFMSNQYTLYLIEATDFQRIRFHYDQKVPPDYGSSSYYRTIDLNAPQQPVKVENLTPQDNPWLVTAYPFGYYAVVAVWLKVVSLVGPGPAALLLGARILSVILLAGTLVLTYGTLRLFHMRKGRALALTAIVGFFPLTTFVSASIQPDNLTLFLVLLVFYSARRLQMSEWSNARLLWVLALALAALVVTKYHIFAFTIVAILATYLSDHLVRPRPATTMLRTIALMLLPSALFFLVQFWVVWGAGTITGSNLYGAGPGGVLGGIKSAFYDYYRGGPALVSWWGQYGWMDTPLVIGSPAVESKVLLVLSRTTLLVLLLVLFRLAQLSVRFILMAKRGHWRLALQAAFSNPMLTGHFIFTVFMVLLYALTDNSFYAQGRHWFPYTVSGFLITIQYAPRALVRRKVVTVASRLLLAGLLLYCVVGGYYSIKSIRARFYATQTSASGG